MDGNSISPLNHPDFEEDPTLLCPELTASGGDSSEAPCDIDDYEAGMANFAVNPTSLVPDGLELEDWERPA